MIDILKMELENFLERINSGNTNLDEEDQTKLIRYIRDLSSPYLSATKSAEYLGVCRKTFDNYVKKGIIPDGVKEGGETKKWLKSDLDKWK